MAEVPNLTPLTGAQTLQERRERQRLHVKRTYYRKLMELQTLRDTVRQLEDEFERLELEKQENQEEKLERTDVPKSPEYETARQRFNQIVDIKTKLREENEALERVIAQHNRFALKTGSWIRNGELVTNTPEDTRTPALSSPILDIPVDTDTCQALARDTFQRYQEFSDNQAFQSTGMTIFGWNDKRLRTGDHIKFALTKVFKNISALELSQRGWAVVGATNGLAQLYSSSMNVSVTSVQRVDDDNEIKLRVMTSADGRTRVNTLFLVSRFTISDGYVCMIRSLDHEKYMKSTEETLGVRVLWVESHNWTVFRSHDTDCSLEFGGEVQSNAVVGSDIWMLEVLLVALRWESIVIKPVFCICTD